MDAGIRDNHGGKLTVDYLFLKDWIKRKHFRSNYECRDKRKLLKDDKFEQISLIEKIFVPFLNMLYNFEKVQIYNQEQLLKLLETSLNFL